jgi:hypothetical protein
MKKATYAAAAVVAASALGVGAVSVLSPAWAGLGPNGPVATATAPGFGMHGAGPAAGMGRGSGMGDGTCLYADGVASGTLTAEQKTTLAAMAEKEKLAHDLYQAFAGKYETVVFDRIAAAETRHLAAVRTLLDRYGLADPTAGKTAGQFASADVQAAYDAYLREGNASLTAALGVGQKVERADIAALEEAQDELEAPDVQAVYRHLLAASQHHLAAFSR